jgi:hypothetical protein
VPVARAADVEPQRVTARQTVKVEEGRPMGTIMLKSFGSDESNGIYIRADAMDTDLFDSPTSDGFRWVQTVITNDPAKGKNPKDVDQGDLSAAVDDPFYYRTPESDWQPGLFDDNPRRPAPKDETSVTTWTATLTLVSINLKEKLLMPHDILTYGFNVKLMHGTTFTAEVEKVIPFLAIGAR